MSLPLRRLLGTSLIQAPAHRIRGAGAPLGTSSSPFITPKGLAEKGGEQLGSCASVSPFFLGVSERNTRGLGRTTGMELMPPNDTTTEWPVLTSLL